MSCINRTAGQTRQKFSLAALNERLLRLSEQAGRAGFGIAAEQLFFVVAEPAKCEPGAWRGERARPE